MRFHYWLMLILLSLITVSCGGKEQQQSVQPPPPEEQKSLESPGPVTTVAGIGAVTVNWRAVSGATTYTVHYSTGPSLESSIMTDASRTSLTVGGLTAGTPYYFAVTAASADQATAKTAAVSDVPLRLSKVLGGDHVDEGAAIATDTSGNIVLVGTATSHPFDGTLNPGGTSAFLTKRTSLGERVWTRLLGKGNTRAFATAVSPGGDVYVAGYTVDDLDGAHAGWSDFFVASYDSDGGFKWVRQLGVAGTITKANAIAVDAGGNILVTGETSGGLAGASEIGNTDLFIAKYDPSGERKWVKLYGSSGSLVKGDAIAATSSGFVVSGTTSGYFYQNKGSTSPVFIMACDSDGNRIWSDIIGAGDTTEVGGVAVAPDGGIYLAGYSDGSLKGNPKIGEHDMFLSHFSASGEYRWTRTSGISGRYKNATGIAVDGAGRIFVTGTVSGSQGNNLFVESYGWNGDHLWGVVRGEDALDVIGIAVSPAGVYVIGSTPSEGSFETNPRLGYNDVFLAGFNSEGSW